MSERLRCRLGWHVYVWGYRYGDPWGECAYCGHKKGRAARPEGEQ